MARNYPDFIEACLECPSQTKLPLPFRKWAAVSSIAGAMGRKVYYDAGPFRIGANLFIVLIARPGRGKSVSLLLPINQILTEGLSTDPGSNPDSLNWNSTVERFGLTETPVFTVAHRITPHQIPVEMSKCQRLDLESSTPASGQVWESSMTLVTTEFGTLMSRDDKTLQIFLTEMWDYQNRYSDKTKTSGQYMINGPCLNWIACATPDQFVENMPINARSQGLLSRMLPVYFEGESMQQDTHYGSTSDYIIDSLREDLATIAKLRGAVTFDPAIADDVREEVRAGIEPKPTDPNLTEYNERRTSHFIKVAMSVTASRSDDLVITREDWDKTKELILEAEQGMPTVLQHFGMSKTGRQAIDLQIYVKDMMTEHPKGLPVFVVKQEIMRRATYPAEVDQTLTAMHEAGMLIVQGNRVFPVKDETKKEEAV